ncbi:hypothetical protein CYMTET_33509 [Cymbomonas tetramitiformis]|uniref:Uncharacterized protein n=1 Tax=Cymbomonas tetramitiformis TaxID=36881 RepID=A0AAE0KQW3_9CHLO|nr:hypothetical protein CYMTET_33509 [Cymbomonas tetramitiformis]
MPSLTLSRLVGDGYARRLDCFASIEMDPAFSRFFPETGSSGAENFLAPRTRSLSKTLPANVAAMSFATFMQTRDVARGTSLESAENDVLSYDDFVQAMALCADACFSEGGTFSLDASIALLAVSMMQPSIAGLEELSEFAIKRGRGESLLE